MRPKTMQSAAQIGPPKPPAPNGVPDGVRERDRPPAVAPGRPPGDSAARPAPGPWPQILLFSLFYGCMAFVVISATSKAGIATAVAPTTGLAVGAFFLLIGREVGPCAVGIGVAGLVVHLMLGDSEPLAAAWAIAGGLSFALVAWGCIRTGVERELLLSVPMVVGLAVVAVAGTVPGALLVAVTRVFEGGAGFSRLFLNAWVPEMAAVMLLLPPFLLWHSRHEKIEAGLELQGTILFHYGDRGRQEIILASAALAGSIAAAWVFGEPLLLNIGACILLWFAFRLGVFSTSLAASVFSVVVILLQIVPVWEVAPADLVPELLKTQGRLVFATFPALLIAAIMAQRERQRRELEEDQRRLAYALDGANDGIWDWHVPSDAVFFSARAYRMLGYDPVGGGTILAQFRDLIHPDDLQATVQAFKEHGEGRHPLYQAEMRARHRNGTYVWLLNRGKIVERTDTGDPVRAVGTITDISQRKHLEAALEHAASHDPLTGLANRTTFDRALEQARRRLARDGAPFAILLIDIDHFKGVNDKHGHMAGDLLLTTTARRLQAAIRAGDIAARFGGDEFAMIASGKGPEEFSALASRLHEHLSRPVETEGLVLPASFSIGVAVASDSTVDTSTLFAEADAALYAAKNAGRGTWRALGMVTHGAGGSPADGPGNGGQVA